MRYLISATLILAAIIHLLPLPGVIGSERLAMLYGLDFSEANLAILMRHRAVLFGILGAFLAIAAFRPAWQPTAFVVGLISVVSFLWLARTADNYNAHIARVVIADVVVLLGLVIGAGAFLWVRMR